MGSSLGRIFRVTTFGESHGEGLGCVIENCPAGVVLSTAEIQYELNRRKPGQSKVTTPRKESDEVNIVSGIFEGRTIGSPIMMLVYNKNVHSKDYEDFKDTFRPSHADYTYQMKYGYRSFLGGGRASARTTIGVVAAGALAKKILKEKAKIDLCGYVSQVENESLSQDFALPSSLELLKKEIEKNPIRCPDQFLAKKIETRIQKIRQEGDSLGGIIELIIENVPAGLGDPTFDRLDALLAHVMLSIPATKGVDIGSGFQGVSMKGSEHNDIFFNDAGTIKTKTNFSGGIQGGISNGEPIRLRIAFKPTATVSKEQKTVKQDGSDTLLKVKGRHDPCVLPRAVPIVEALAALTLADQYLLSQLSDYSKL